ncbi:epimerase [Spirochaetia bacterium]|nr:epimerase [Spirochaetia bacterium]
MNKIKVGITGQAGFVGTHLYNELGLFPEKYERILFKDSYFDDPALMAQFVKQCDVIVHLAAVNRHPDENELYTVNVNLVNALIRTLIQENVKPHIIFSSSIQERLDNLYGKSKQEGRRLLAEWAEKNRASFTALIIPNVYGPFGLPNYNSFVATFCQKLTHGEVPQIITDNDVNLIYVSSLCKHIIADIEESQSADSPMIQEKHIPFDFTKKVSVILEKLKMFKECYFDQGIIPAFKNSDDSNLFNTFRSYIDLSNYFPYRLKQNTDMRGTFVETIKLNSGGQISFSTTKPNITRGNHFHTRKIERFTVIKGKAKIQLRKIGTDRIIDFCLDGSEPSYVDMPVWYTHNITNIGADDLYTQFWINEFYNEADPDTYFEGV